MSTRVGAVAPFVVLLFACDPRLDAGYNLSVAADASPPFSINNVATDLSLNGTAELSGGELVLTQAQKNQGGTAFFPMPFAVNAATTMDVHLVFRIGPSDDPADGVALVWHADPQGPRALGGNGGGLSVGDLSPKVAVVFDTHDGSDLELVPAVSIERNEDRSSSTRPHARAAPFPLASGKPIHCWVVYRSGDMKVFVAESPVKPNEPWIEAPVVLEAEVGDSLYFGVAASTGARFSRHAVHALQVSVTR